MAKITNTFDQGMDRDSSKNKYDNVHYWDAKNMRLVTQEGLSGGALENLRGNYLRLNVAASGHYIVGDVVIGDYLVIWTSDNNTSTPNGSSVDRIFKIAISTLEALTGASTLTLDTDWFHDGGSGNLIYTGNLWLCTGNLIKPIARYENDSIQKVYWIDKYNRLRHLNLVYNADTNDLENMSEDKLEAVGNIDLTQPQVVDMPYGGLRSGRIQYTYQLYGKHGAETVFSPLSGMINLANYPEASSTSEAYRGSDIDELTGKAVKCTIAIDSTGYTRLRIVAVHYTSLAGEPEIRIAEEREISGSAETIYFTDTGNNLGSLLLEDIRTVGTLLFIPKELETKDNILFPANITEESFDTDYDARAYRFGGANATSTEPNWNFNSNRRTVSRVYENDGSYFLIYGSAITRLGAGGTAAKGDWEYYDSSDVYQAAHDDYDQSGYGTAFGIPEEADAINHFNDLDNDGIHLNRYMYQGAGIIPGGEGVNVSYKFKIKEMIIDDATTTRQRLYTVPEGTVDNPSYHGYASPYNVQKYLGYHRDEVYRFGIVFFDDKGRSSFVKWIGDIRFPSISTLSNQTMYNAGGGSPTPQIGTITVGYIDAVVYTVNVGGIICSFDNDNGFGSPIFSDATGVGNALRNVMQNEIGSGASTPLATLSPNVAGVWTVTFDQVYGDYTVTTDDFYVTWAQTQGYAPGVGASDDYSIAWNNASDTIGNIMYIEFTVDNLPASAESYQIVRVKREALDRSVMGQGVVGGVTSLGLAFNWDDAASYSNMYTFASPEVAFNKDLTQRSSDFLQEVGELNDNVNVDSYLTDLVLYNYHTVVPMNNPQLQEIAGAGSALGDEHEEGSKTNIVDGQIVAQDQVEANIGADVFYVNNSGNFTDKGISFVFEAENTTWRSKNKPYTHASDGRKLINYRRNIFSTQYEGLSFNNRKQNIYIAASDIVDKVGTSVNVFGGDTYIGMFDYLYSSWQEGEVASTQPEVLYFPVETSINLPLRLDDCYHRIYTASFSDFLHETAGVWTNGTNEFPQTNNLYRYNTVYSKENDTKLFIKAPFDWTSETDFPVRVRNSNIKIPNELADSWLIFGTNAYKDVDPQWGEITNLTTVNEKIMFFQPKAFGVLSVNERALLGTGTISQLTLGKSGVLERFDYAKTGIGASDRRHVLLTPNGLYWIDTITKAMYKYTGGPEEMSIMKGMDSFFRTSLVNGSTTFLFHDPEFKEVMVSDYTDSWTLVYNELTDSFTGFNDFFPTYVIKYNDRIWGTRNNIAFYKHNDEDADRGHLYGSYYDTSITLLINPGGVALFNNAEWLTEAFTQAGVDTPITFDEVTFWNDYQHSGLQTLTVNQDVKRRMRKWRMFTPRALYLRDGVTTQKQNDGTTAKTDARFRDSHMFMKLGFTNDANDRRFVSHDITTSFIPSNS